MAAMRKILQFETFTGWHMLAIMLLFFGTIISVNVTMAYLATSSWSGLLVQNTYVESQRFDEEVALEKEMQLRGWRSELTLATDAVNYRLVDAEGRPVIADTVTVSLSRPVGVDLDQQVMLAHAGDGFYRAAVPLQPGQWVAKVVAMDEGALLYRDTYRLHLQPGR